MNLPSPLRGVVLALSITALAVPALAQADAAQRAASAVPVAQSGSQYSDQTLQQFASAYMEITAIRQTYTQRLQQAQGTDKAKSLQQEAREKMVSAVEGQGMSLQTYNQIAQSLQNNPQLRARVIEMIKQRQQQPR